MDPNLGPVPFGVRGELVLGGDGLAWGYWRRPGLTAERFIPDPLGGGSGQRLYRTGDWVIRRVDGDVDFRGRVDHQIKLRGFRIELGEIETALVDQDEVAEALILLVGEGADRRLVAYLVLAEGAELSVEDLRRRLGESLPEVMVPAAYVFLDEMPLGPTGKRDRKALVARAGEATTAARVKAPRTALETVIAGRLEGPSTSGEPGRRGRFLRIGGPFPAGDPGGV